MTALLIRPSATPRPPRPPVEPGFPAEPAAFPSARAVWPEAVVKIPAWSFRDWPLRPLARMDATQVLMEEVAEPGQESWLVAFNLQMGVGRPLVSLPNDKDRDEHQITAAAATDGAVAWYRTVQEKSGTVGELWTKTAAGKAVLLATIPGVTAGRDPELAIIGQDLLWSFPQGGVDRIPLAGGERQRVPDTDGMRIKDWPWIGNEHRLINTATGERITIRAPAQADIDCGPDWCVGTQTVATATERVFIQRPDGSRRTELPPWVVSPLGLLGQRYLLLRTVPQRGAPANGNIPGSVVYDVETGVTATLTSRYGPEPVHGPVGVANSLIYWATSDKATEPPKSDIKRNLVSSASAYQGADIPEKYWLLDSSAMNS
ncbi:hypothetical protein [Acrocarpospora catenulata]|uniref:hypothetical protein n=1 Tax=Acrocarpospora catenulata TaxID=2836182 RepID=UPI001BDA9771|nr:hypothetical protein [Acrocarpospora catenulata]